MKHWRLLLAVLALFLWIGPLGAQRSDYGGISEWTDAELRLEFRSLRRSIDSVTAVERALQRRVDSLTVALFRLEMAHQPTPAKPPVLLETSGTAAARYRPITYDEMYRFLAEGSWLKPRVLAFSVVPLGYVGGRLDRDPGGYRDEWTGHDKIAHAAASAYLTSVLADAGVDGWNGALAPALVIVTGAAFEAGQGTFSGRDLAWDAGGALLSYAVRKVLT